MIFGIGTDIIRLDRIEATLARFGEHFVRRLLLPEELAAYRKYRRKARFLAMRFAGKEAVVKAMGFTPTVSRRVARQAPSKPARSPARPPPRKATRAFCWLRRRAR